MAEYNRKQLQDKRGIALMKEERTDWKYPIVFNNGCTEMNSLENDIRQSLYMLLSTRKGERIMRPNYGCNLSQFAFETVNYSLLNNIRSEVITAIKLFEPRVENVNVVLDTADGSTLSAETLVINITYKIKENAREQMLSFPLKEQF